MNALKIFLFSIVFTTSLVAQSPADSKALSLEFDDDTYRELSLKEWKKFKAFEQRLGVISNKEEQVARLSGFARDSIQILGVKLMAIKLLDKKKLLDRDIVENGKYYSDLLHELRESAIPQTEYRFLEEKMAYLNQAELQSQLGQSRWFNIGLLLLCLGLVYMVFHLKKRARKVLPPELSKQEATVQNLILQGKSNKEIANELFISLSTVKSHITNLYAKLNVANRQELFQKSTGTST